MSKKGLGCVMFFLAFSLNESAQSADVRLVPDRPAVKRITRAAHVQIVGEIVDDDAVRLRDALSQLAALRPHLQTPIVLLDSPGGSVPAALEIGRILRRLSVIPSWTKTLVAVRLVYSYLRAG
jgi:ClpP class serine protease